MVRPVGNGKSKDNLESAVIVQPEENTLRDTDNQWWDNGSVYSLLKSLSNEYPVFVLLLCSYYISTGARDSLFHPATSPRQILTF